MSKRASPDERPLVSSDHATRVCHLTSVHSAFDPRIFRKELRSLAAAGYSVALVAPHERDLVVEGVSVRSIPLVATRRERLTRSIWRVYVAALREHAELYHFHDPELIPVGLALKARGHKVVYDAHENVPDSILSKDYLPKNLRKLASVLVGALELVGAHVFDRVVAATPVIARRFPPSKTVAICNFPLQSEFLNERSAIPYREREALIVYVGGISEPRGIRELVQAVGVLPPNLDARLLLAGEFDSKELRTWISRSSVADRIQVLGWLDGSLVPGLLATARVGVVTLHPTPAYVEALPTKLFEYMAAGIPVVASNFPLWTEIVDSAGCGLLVNPLDPVSIANALNYLLTNPLEAGQMGERGREAIKRHYSWDAEQTKLLAMYSELVRH